MSEDQRTFENVLGLSTVTTISYQGEALLNFDDPSMIVVPPPIGQRKVLLGNSACYTDSYLRLLPCLTKMGKGASFTCMLSYPEDVADEHKQDVIEKYTSVFGESFSPWTQQLAYDKYMERMRQQDIYICNVDRQTGLGAIYVMLMYGKKVYLAGRNLAWIRENGFNAHDVKELETESVEAFLTLPSIEEKKHNHDRLLEVLSPAKLAKEWNRLYSQLL